MHKILFLLFFITCSLSVNAGNSSPLLDSANIAYAKKDFTRAISLYEKELSLDQEAPELYYNLGNAYFKNNNIPMAILNYERAKKLKPEDEDLEVNLKLANQQIADKMDGAEIHFLSVWKNRMLNTCSERAWSLWSIGAWVAGIAFLSLYFLSSRMILRQLFLSMCALFILLSVSTFLIARSKYSESTNRSEAIVMSPNVTAKGSPDEKGTDLFILHEGTKVSLIQSTAGWTEVKLGNGHTGWLPLSALEVI